jgi:hypothetical protein
VVFHFNDAAKRQNTFTKYVHSFRTESKQLSKLLARPAAISVVSALARKVRASKILQRNLSQDIGNKFPPASHQKIAAAQTLAKVLANRNQVKWIFITGGACKYREAGNAEQRPNKTIKLFGKQQKKSARTGAQQTGGPSSIRVSLFFRQIILTLPENERAKRLAARMP